MKRRLFIVALLSIFLCETCLADNNLTQVSRYLTVSNKPKLSQTNLLSQLIQVRFTRNVQSVGDAMNYLLKFSGYSLIAESQMSPEMKSTLQKPLPIVDRELGPITLSDALSILSGPAFYLTHDPVNRVVNFKLKPAYQKFIQNNQIRKA
jgi:type IV pili sensor histidine kinase/response regulator